MSGSEAPARETHGERGRAREADVRRLAGIYRPSASAGEREAAEWIAGRLRALGVAAQIEQEHAHGGYWWPVIVPNAAAMLGAVAALRGRTRRGRLLAALLGGAGAASLWDDLGGGRQWLRRLALPKRATWNVLGEAGASAERATRTVLLLAHHDSAHSGAVFHPSLPRLIPDRFPEMHARATQTFPIMHLTWAGPWLALAGAVRSSRRMLWGAVLFCLGTIAAMLDIAVRDAVPGANDNLSAVAVLLALAESLADRPPPEGTRVLLLSTGSEESILEGMRGFAARHFGELDPVSTEVLCLECVGGPSLVVLEGEGMLLMRDYPRAAREGLAQAAARAGVVPRRNLRTVAATDGLIALRAGFSTCTLASIDYTGFPANYHWPSDAPENLDWETLGEAIAVTEEWVRGPGREAQ